MAETTLTQYVMSNKAVLAGLADVKNFDVQALGQEIDALPVDQRTGEGVWQRYRNDPSSAIYRQLLQDKDRALAVVQIAQVRQIIAAIEIVDRNGQQDRAFVSIQVDDGARQYVARGEIIASTDLQINTLKQAEKEMGYFQQRYRMLTELCPMARDIQMRAREQIRDLETARATQQHDASPQQSRRAN